MVEPASNADAKPWSRIPYLRGILWAIGIVLGVAIVALVASGWYFSGLLEQDGLRVEHSDDELDLLVVAVGPSWIELRPGSGDDELQRDGTYRLEWDGGSAPVGGILESNGMAARREFDPTQSGSPTPGSAVRLDGFAFEGDPATAHGIVFDEVQIAGELGSMPAWHVPGEPREWVIFVHGKGSRRQEALRMLPTAQAAGPSLLVVTYRNDEGAPASPDGRYGFGTTEWKDLEAAVIFAKEQGAENVLLVGYSMGGAIVLSFVEHSSEASLVGALILDAPMLSFGSSVDLAASDMHLPGILTATGKKFATWRFGVDWSAMDYRDNARELSVPLLLIHGDEDDRTPVEDSDALAAESPEIVTYIRFEGAEHVRAWNVDPVRYEEAVANFLQAQLSVAPSNTQ